MPVTATSTVLVNNQLRYIVRIRGVASDATEETDGNKIDVSTLTGPRTGFPGAGLSTTTQVVIDKIDYHIGGFSNVALEWDATTDVLLARLPQGQGILDFTTEGGLQNPGGTGATGDVLLTTTGAAAGASYDITLYCRKKDKAL